MQTFRHTVLGLMAAVVLVPPLVGQPSTSSPMPVERDVPPTTGDRTPDRYDTLAITTPRHADLSPVQRLGLGAFAAASLPVHIALAAASLAPPSVVILRDGDVSHGGIALSTGCGVGRRWDDLTYWPELRLQVEWAHLFRRPVQTLARLTVLRDIPILPLDDRRLLWFGASGGLGVSHDVNGGTAFVEGSITVMNPMGISYVLLYPMHTWGIRVRMGSRGENNRWWHEIALGGTATFAF